MEKAEWWKSNTMVGIFFCSAIFGLGFLMAGNIGLYFNLVGLLIVAGGTFGATLIGYSSKRLMIVFQILKRSFQVPVKGPHEIVRILVDLSVKSKMKGILSLEEDEGETSLLFLRRGLGLLVDGYKPEEISEILVNEMYFFKMRRAQSERVLRTMADLSPSFGIVGSIIGLMGMIAGSGDTSTIIATIPIALTSTLYGIIFTNFFFRPFEAKIRDRTNQELLLQKISVEGIIAIATELNPRILEAKLKSFLTPSSREGKLVSLRRIQETFRMKESPATRSLSPVPPVRYSEGR